MTLKQTFSERFKILLDKNNLSLRDFEKLFKIAHFTAQNWHNGRTIPRIKKILDLRHFFNCTTDYILGLKDCQN